MAKVDIAAAIMGATENVSNLDTPHIELIDLDLIETNENNFYGIRDLDPLIASIQMEGLQQPLLVVTSEADPRKVRIVSGHRRHAAITALVNGSDKEKPRPEFRAVPCIRRQQKSPALEELQLILANSTTRVLTSAEVMEAANRTEKLLYQLKNEGYEFPGRMRQQVAAACQVSESKLARLRAIRERLIPHFLEQFKANNLTEQAAYELSQLDADQQERCAVAAGTRTVIGGIAQQVRQNFQRGRYSESTMSCPDSKTPCCNTDRILAHDIRAKYSWGTCEHQGCCCDCRERASCSMACKKAKDKVIREKAKAKADNEKAESTRLTAREAQADIMIAFLCRAKEELARCGFRLTKDSPEYIRRGLCNYYSWAIAAQMLDGSYDPSGGATPYISPTFGDFVKMLLGTGASADRILGLEPKPVEGAAAPAAASAPAWIPVTEDLPKNTDYVFVLTDCGEVEEDYLSMTQKKWAGQDGAFYVGNVTHWMPKSVLLKGTEWEEKKQ